MSYGKQKSAKKEYFNACFLAIFTAVAGLVEPGAEASNGLILVGVLAVLIVVGSYFQMGRATQEAGQEDIVPSESRLRRMAILYNDANEAMIENAKLFGTLFKADGGTVITEEACNEKETNFLPLVTKLASMNLDGIYFSIYAEQSANIMIQLRQGGLPANVRFFGEQGLASPRLVEIGGKATEGVVVPGQFMAGVDRPLNKHFEAAYMARYKTKPAFFEAIGYSCGLVALKAIKDAMPNLTRENVRNALEKIRDVPVVVGNGLWNHKERNGNYGVVVTEVKDGKFVVAP